MCGITGFWTRGGGGSSDPAAVLSRMTASLVHRGPDDGAVWSDADAGIHLGFRRLAIIDVSPLGAQPMASASGRYRLRVSFRPMPGPPTATARPESTSGLTTARGPSASRSTPRTASTAKPATSRTPTRTSPGCRPKAAAARITRICDLVVHFAPMSDGDNQDDETVILDCSDDAVVADAITPQAL